MFCSFLIFGKNIKYYFLNLKWLDFTPINFKNLETKVLNYTKIKMKWTNSLNQQLILGLGEKTNRQGGKDWIANEPLLGRAENSG